VIASVPGYPARLTDARTELDSEPVKAVEIERIAYSVPETVRALGLSRELIYDELRSNRLGSVKIGWRRIITRQHIDAWLAVLDSLPSSSTLPNRLEGSADEHSTNDEDARYLFS
jgi:excisionase family DNA binding protein